MELRLPVWFNKGVRIKDFSGEIAIFLFSSVVRLPSLGWDIFNADAFLWKARSYNFSSAIFSFDFAKTAQVAHPGVTLMWLSTLAIKAYNAFNKFFRTDLPSDRQQIFELHFAQKLVVVIVTSLLLTLSFYLLRRLVGFWAALFSILILSLEPFFLAHTRIYHLDALLTMSMFVAVLFLINFLAEAQNQKYLILPAVFSALAMVTKSSALFLLPFSLLIISTTALRQPSRKLRFFLLNTCYFLLATAATSVAVWPAMWVQPLETLSLYFSGISGEGFGGHDQIIFGEVTANPGPIFYPLSLWIRLSPWVLVLSCLGISFLARNFLRKDRSPESLVLLVTFLFAVFYLSFLTIPSKKLERYALPIYPFLSVLAGFSLFRLRENFRQKVPRADFLIIAFIVLIFTLSVYRIHPDYLAYYSPLVGGLKGGIQAIRPDWSLGAARVGEYLNSQASMKPEIKVLVPETDQFRPFIVGLVSDTRGVEKFDKFDYVVLPVWSLKGRFAGVNPVHIVEIDKVPIYNIYQVEEEPLQ